MSRKLAGRKRYRTFEASTFGLPYQAVLSTEYWAITHYLQAVTRRWERVKEVSLRLATYPCFFAVFAWMFGYSINFLAWFGFAVIPAGLYFVAREFEARTKPCQCTMRNIVFAERQSEITITVPGSHSRSRSRNEFVVTKEPIPAADAQGPVFRYVAREHDHAGMFGKHKVIQPYGSWRARLCGVSKRFWASAHEWQTEVRKETV